MKNNKIFTMNFADIYKAYQTKITRKNGNTHDVDILIFSLTSHDSESFAKIISEKISVENFFKNPIQWNENSNNIVGTICGYKIEEIEDETMQQIRMLDKIIDELAKGKSVEKILEKYNL